MLTKEEYRQSLDDGRVVYFEGEQVNVATHKMFKRSLTRIFDTMDKYCHPERDEIPEYYKTPSTAEDMRKFIELTLDPVINNSFGALMTLLTAADRLEDVSPERSKKMREYVETSRRKGIMVGECITDAKGDRARRPGNQDDPDAYLRVVERRDDGVVVRGAKLHISGAALCNDLMVIPTKAMKKGEEEYAIAFVIPVNAPGLKVISMTAEPRDEADLRESWITQNHHTQIGFVVFDDVFIPNENIFLDGEVEHAATFAHSLGLWVRTSGLRSLADEADMFVGFAQLLAEANGLTRVEHVKSKITDMVLHATLIRATLEASLANAVISEEGNFAANELYANAGKYIGAAHRSQMINHIIDIAGGSITTVPSLPDLESEEIGHYIRKYMSTRQEVDGDYRSKLMLAARDITCSVHAGHRVAAMMLSGGGLFAQRVVLKGRYNMDSAKQRALNFANLKDPSAEA